MLPNNSTQGLMGLIDAASVLNRPSQMVGPQQAEDGMAGLIKGNTQTPTALGGLSQDAVPNGGDMQSVMSILGQNQGSAPASTPSGGGMFDAYSPQNQTNLQMAMIADMIGNFAGRDVGAMKTMMPLAENARKLRLQGEENAAFNKMVEGMPPDMRAMFRNAPKSLQSIIMQGAIARLNQKPADQWGEPYVGQFGNLLRKNKTTNKVERVSGPQAEGQTFNYGGQNSPLAIAEGKAFVLAKQNMSAGRDDARNRLRPQQVMRSLLNQKDADGNPVLKTGAFKALTLPMQQMWNSMVDSVAAPGLAASLQAGDTSYAEIFQSNEKAAALISAALMKGNLSEKELQFSQDIQAMLAKTRGANIILTELTIMREQARVSEADHMEDWELELDPIKWKRSDGSEDVKELHSLWKKELRRYRANDAQQLNDAFMKDLWTNKLGLKEMSEGGYREYDEFDQKVGESEDDYEARLKAMSAEQ
jgi:hypothetical protein